MKTFSPDEITDVAQSIVALTKQAYANLGFLHLDANAMALVALFSDDFDVQCVDFTSTQHSIDSGFYWHPETETLFLNQLALAQIFKRSRRRKCYRAVSDDDLMRHVIGLFLFHEAYHIIQGLTSFEDVQVVKKVAKKSLLGELDTMADCVAARVYAAFITYSMNGDITDYFACLIDALTMSYFIGLLSFPFSKDAVHKCERGLSLLIVRQQILIAIQANKIAISNSFASHAQIDIEQGAIVVTALEQTGGKKLVSAKTLSSSSLRELTEAIAKGHFDLFTPA